MNKKRFVRKRRFKKSTLQSQINKIKKNLNVENKEFNIELIAATIVGGSGAIQQLTNIRQGDTTFSRDGSQCKVTSVQGRGIIQHNPLAIDTVVRLLLVLDRQTNQAIYMTSDLLLDTALIESLISPYNLDNKSRFKVLWDRTFTLSQNSKTVTAFKFYKKLDLLLRFDGNTPSIADLTQNSLSLVRISNENDNPPQFDLITRVRFVDN